MKIYVITEGDYSSYHICDVAIDINEAEKIRKMAAYDARIEIFDTDKHKGVNEGFKLYEVRLWSNGKISVKQTDYYSQDWLEVHESRDDMCVDVFARDAKHAFKIASDKFAEYKYKKEIDNPDGKQ